MRYAREVMTVKIMHILRTHEVGSSNNVLLSHTFLIAYELGTRKCSYDSTGQCIFENVVQIN